MIKKMFNNIGPGTLIAAAFIGPGTVTLCTLAGVHFGFDLLWAMILSIIATIILQEMAARLGLISQKGLSEIIKSEIKNPWANKLMIILILSAIVIGNASYEAGNISGGILGLETIFGKITLDIFGHDLNVLSLIIGGIAFVLLYFGNYVILERALITLVLLMSISFLITAVITQPHILEVLKGAFVPSVPKHSLLTIIGLIGTTVVPYNLFLHASLVKEKWNKKEDLKAVRKDTVVSIILGGLISIAIIITASSIREVNITNAADLAKSLTPLYGDFATYFLSIGLFSAGITSAITAPLAAAYVAKGCLGWSGNLKSKKFKSVWIFILTLGVLFSSLGIKPIEIIQFAQITNGILLPIIVGVLLWVLNKKSVLGSFVNSATQNVFGVSILIITFFLGIKGIFKVLGIPFF